MKKRISVVSLFAIVCALTWGAGVYAQATRATIVGTVKDPSGAVLPGVSITVKNTGTGLTRNTSTNETGDYTVPLLPIGSYEVTAEIGGFKTQVKSGITLQVDDRVRIDFGMEIGQITDRVVVTESAPLLQSENASVGNVIDHTKIVELPLDGRDYYSLAQLNPAIYAAAQDSTMGSRGAFNVAGTSEVNNNYVLDGIQNLDDANNQPLIKPAIDTIQEFKVLTGTYSAEYGRRTGGQILVTTRSGTNELHGTAYNFYRNSAMDARNFFASSITPFTRNQFGGALGGPIIRNRTFFFGGYEGLRAKEQITALATVPSLAMRKGDLSELLSSSNLFTNRATIITDPQTKTPFPNNVIPAGRTDAVARELINAWYPEPNRTGALNYRSSGDRPTTIDQFNVRIDHRVSTGNSLSGGYQYMDRRIDQPLGNIGLCGNRLLPGLGCIDNEKTLSTYISDVHVFSPNLVHELRAGISRLDGGFWPMAAGKGIEDRLKIKGLPGYVFPGLVGPQATISGFATIGPPTNVPQARKDTTYNLLDTLVLNHGNHSLKFGVDLRYFMYAGYNIATRAGSFSFNGFLTGYSFGDFLLGFPRTASRNTGEPNNVVTDFSHNYYVMDDWKIFDRLTLNVGVRYEFSRALTERHDEIASYDRETNKLRLPRGGEAFIDAAGQIIIRKGTGDNRLWDYDKNNLAPRIGIAYRPFSSGSFVVRAGYGVYYNLTPTSNGLNDLFRGLPYDVSTTLTSSTANPIPLADPFTPAPGRTAGGFSAGSIDRLLLMPYVQQYSLSVQKEITSSLMAEATYMGSQGTKLLDSIPLNQPTPGSGSIDARRPIQPWGNITYRGNIGRSWFNSLQMRIDKRMANGVSGTLAYTLGKSLDTGSFLGTSSTGNVGAQNPRDYQRSSKGLSAFDVRHRLVASYVVDLPFGRGRRYLNSASRVADALLGGWEIAGILTLQSGTPFSPIISFDNSNTGTTNRPNLIGDWSVKNPTPTQWFNKEAFCFSQSCGLAPFTFGNAGRNILIGPGLKNLDFSLMKNFRVREGHRIQFRSEFFNFTNHPNFLLPSGTVDLGSGGTINQARNARTVQLAFKYIF